MLSAAAAFILRRTSTTTTTTTTPAAFREILLATSHDRSAHSASYPQRYKDEYRPKGGDAPQLDSRDWYDG